MAGGKKFPYTAKGKKMAKAEEKKMMMAKKKKAVAKKKMR